MNTTTTNQPNHQSSQSADTEDRFEGGPQPLCRPVHDRMLAGVASGFARYLGVDVTVVRVVLAVLAVIGGAGVPVYLLGWLLIPEEGCDQSIASSFIQSHQSRRYDR
jgi:phage shock protein PspC (stress-responsive transcriptional regulator)